MQEEFDQWGSNLLPAVPATGNEEGGLKTRVVSESVAASIKEPAAEETGVSKRKLAKEKEKEKKELLAEHASLVAKYTPKTKNGTNVHSSSTDGHIPPAVRHAIGQKEQRSDRAEHAMPPRPKSGARGNAHSFRSPTVEDIIRVAGIDDFVPLAVPSEVAKRAKLLTDLEEKDRGREELAQFIQDLRARSHSSADGSQALDVQFPDNFETVANLITAKDLDRTQRETQPPSEHLSPKTTHGESQVSPSSSNTSQTAAANHNTMHQWFSIALEEGIDKAAANKNALSQGSRRGTPRDKSSGSSLGGRGRSGATSFRATSSSSSAGATDSILMEEIEKGLAIITQLDRELVERTKRATEMASTQIVAPEVESQFRDLDNAHGEEDDYESSEDGGGPQTQEPLLFFTKQEKYASDRQAFAVFAKVAADARDTLPTKKRPSPSHQDRVTEQQTPDRPTEEPGCGQKPSSSHRKTSESGHFRKKGLSVRQSSSSTSSDHVPPGEVLSPASERLRSEQERDHRPARSIMAGGVGSGSSSGKQQKQRVVSQRQDDPSRTFLTACDQQSDGVSRSLSTCDNNEDELQQLQQHRNETDVSRQSMTSTYDFTNCLCRSIWVLLPFLTSSV
jgi:hypothetical protein